MSLVNRLLFPIRILPPPTRAGSVQTSTPSTKNKKFNEVCQEGSWCTLLTKWPRSAGTLLAGSFAIIAAGLFGFSYLSKPFAVYLPLFLGALAARGPDR